MATQITTSSRADGITLLKISCPERRNILDEASYAQLIDALASAEADDGVKVLIITAARTALPQATTWPITRRWQRRRR
ncbi:hypothetical protein [Halomonas sp. BC04]|uniref:hypothetical protein n=1 Tax=Halomonas sp. BC04 TaxID=1403540 RepID=UPI0003ED8849|nr:hypothetical protein [Halomonas sp. BC04]EWH03145.1 hypothetical protein Q427_04905 [Halomonas sp. BC04]